MWIKYRITDASGTGWNHWKFTEVQNGSDKDDIKHYIIHSHESWAIYADRYDLDFMVIDITELPDHIIDYELTVSQASIDFHTQRRKDLWAVLNNRNS